MNSSMRITGIESLEFGVEDLASCGRACDDFGLIRRAAAAIDAQVFEARDGSSIVLRAVDDPSLPPTTIAGSTLRLLVWGVKDAATLEAIAAELRKDREVTIRGDLVHSRDDNDMAIAFRISRKRDVADPLPAANVPGHFQRPVNTRVDFTQRVTPRAIAHVVFNCADEPAARAFYVERLGFIVSDSFRNTGAFLRTAVSREHHCLFTVQRKPAALNHVAFYVTDFHEVMIGGMRMSQAGWSSNWGPGRHKLGSNYFWYFKSPLGGALEYTCDVDYVDENWVPQELEFSSQNSQVWAAQGIISSI